MEDRHWTFKADEPHRVIRDRSLKQIHLAEFDRSFQTELDVDGDLAAKADKFLTKALTENAINKSYTQVYEYR